ncbi:MAG TPA: hypothetical protein VKD90_12725 [Gemmataceae bacterium]|nr:hypothetical protein [Gemmataceae bacterium]
MLRTIVGVIVGFLVLFGLLFVSFTAAYAVLGPDRAFQPGTYEVSTLWIAVGVAFWLGAGLAGGYVCARIARRRAVANTLFTLVLALGLLGAMIGIVGRQGGESAPRTGDVSSADARSRAEPPTWAALLSPVIGAAGVLVGGRRRDLPPD